MVNVVWTKRALKQLLSINSRFRETIVEKTKQLVAFPVAHLDVKKLKDSGTPGEALPVPP